MRRLVKRSWKMSLGFGMRPDQTEGFGIASSGRQKRFTSLDRHAKNCGDKVFERISTMKKRGMPEQENYAMVQSFGMNASAENPEQGWRCRFTP
jgi:hypothetical protein